MELRARRIVQAASGIGCLLVAGGAATLLTGSSPQAAAGCCFQDECVEFQTEQECDDYLVAALRDNPPEAPAADEADGDEGGDATPARETTHCLRSYRVTPNEEDTAILTVSSCEELGGGLEDVLTLASASWSRCDVLLRTSCGEQAERDTVLWPVYSETRFAQFPAFEDPAVGKTFAARLGLADAGDFIVLNANTVPEGSCAD